MSSPIAAFFTQGGGAQLAKEEGGKGAVLVQDGILHSSWSISSGLFAVCRSQAMRRIRAAMIMQRYMRRYRARCLLALYRSTGTRLAIWLQVGP